MTTKEFPCATALCFDICRGSSLISEFCTEHLVHVYIYLYTPSLYSRFGLREFAGCLVLDCGFVFRGFKILRLQTSAYLTLTM